MFYFIPWIDTCNVSYTNSDDHPYASHRNTNILECKYDIKYVNLVLYLMTNFYLGIFNFHYIKLSLLNLTVSQHNIAQHNMTQHNIT